MKKAVLLLSAFASLLTSESALAVAGVTVTDFAKSGFCKEFLCGETSPYKSKDGEMAMQIRLAKDPLNYDLLAVLNGKELKRLTIRFTSDGERVDKKALISLLTSLIGHAPADGIVEKIMMSASLKTKKDDLLNNDKLSVDSLSVRAGDVLKKPTIIVDL